MTLKADKAATQGTQVVPVLDFDGTLTRRDSFVPFLKFAFGSIGFKRGILRLALPSVRFLTRDLKREELKAQLISTFLTGEDVKCFQKRTVKF